ncbi:MAG TPA: sugar MFS transporter [Allosphingosinicella sp.]|nr:sugar MFS transporter [Allosphingosinicella sp.]
MAMAPASPARAAAVPGDEAPADLKWFVFILFFVFGGITSLNDVLIPKLKHLFTLNWAEAMMIQFAFFAAYFIVSLPAAALLKRVGYMRTAVIGLLVMMAACLLFIPASYSGLFVAFLGALFMLGAGITTVQVVANPLISMLGRPQTAHSRLTFAQAFNSLGTTVFPFVGAHLILGSLNPVDETSLSGEALSVFRAQETEVIVTAYIGIALALLVVAGAVWLRRNRLVEETPPQQSMWRSFDLLKQPRFAFGALGIFVYVGAEVAIASIITNYLMEARTLALAAREAGELLIFYWGGAMVGRFIGAAALRIFPPSLVLFAVAAVAAALLAVSGFSEGAVSGYAILAIGLFNSIMFPTIFSLASEDLGDRRADGSGIICMAIVGGAIVPLLTGFVADATSLVGALIVPFVCYWIIAAFAFYCRRVPSRLASQDAVEVTEGTVSPVQSHV